LSQFAGQAGRGAGRLWSFTRTMASGRSQIEIVAVSPDPNERSQ
jgi:hypothetical protein